MVLMQNARLAMLAYAGFIAQHIVTGTTPLANLSSHLADPWSAFSILTPGVSVHCSTPLALTCDDHHTPLTILGTGAGCTQRDCFTGCLPAC